jgi:hypothetical protein
MHVQVMSRPVIVAVHEPWHENYRYAKEENISVETCAGNTEMLLVAVVG